MGKIQLAVLFGGISTEHEVSRMSVSSILRHLDREKYAVSRIGITKDGRWFLFEGDDAQIIDGSWETAPGLIPAVLSPDAATHGLLLLYENRIETRRIDVVYPALHGHGGEDGTIQGLCALASIACAGSGVTASALCMDKEYTHRILAQEGIPGARWVCVRRHESDDIDRIAEWIDEAGLSYPLFVKPANAGSSVGITKVHGSGALQSALQTAFHEDDKVLLEETLTGTEVECAVMGNDRPVAAASVGEIEPLRELYDYEGKYCDNSTALHIPARIGHETAERVRQTACRAYRALGCRGYARVDFFVRENGQILLNEINTLPGFTAISMFPKLFCHDGMAYGALIDKLIGLAME